MIERIATTTLLLGTLIPSAAAQTVVMKGESLRITEKQIVDVPALPFSGAGRRELVALGDGRVRLVYVLAVEDSRPLADDANVKLGADEFSLEWLHDALEHRVAELEDVALVTAATSRDGTDVYSRERRIEIVGPREAVASAEAMIEGFVRDNRRMVRIEAVVMRREGDDRDSASAADGPHVELLDHEAFDAVVDRWSDPAEHQVIASPSLTTWGGQEATLRIGNEIAYVKDWDVEVVGTRSIADPVIDVVNDGLTLWVRPVIEGQTVHLAVELEVARVVKPIPESTLRLGKLLQEVIIERPEVVVSSASCNDVTLVLAAPTVRISNFVVREQQDVEAVELLLRTRIVEPEVTGAVGTIGVVLGFDPTTREVFIRTTQTDGGGAELLAKRFVFHRDGAATGRGTVLEVVGGVLRARLDDGDVKAGDSAATDDKEK